MYWSLSYYITGQLIWQILFLSIPQEYPAWWPSDLSHVQKQSCKGPQPIAARQPPRLAYSIVESHADSAPFWSDDLVTNQYLDVPSSGCVNNSTFSGRSVTADQRDQDIARPSSESMKAYTAQRGAGKENKKGTCCKEACLS